MPQIDRYSTDNNDIQCRVDGVPKALGVTPRTWNRWRAVDVRSFARYIVGVSALIVPGLFAALHIDATAQPVSIALEEVFRLGEDDGDVFFGHIADIALDAAGRIYVTDPQSPVVQVFSETGKLISTLGGRGEGPGEFATIRNVVVGPDDRVYVWDWDLDRLSVFEQRASGKFEFRDIIRVAAYDERHPIALVGVGTEGIVFLYVTPYGFCDECSNDETRYVNARLVDKDGQAGGDPLVTLPAAERVVVLAGGRISVSPKPFGQKNVVTVSPSGKLYAGRSDAFSIEARFLNGDRDTTYSRQYEPLPVTKRELDTAMEGWSREKREALRKSGIPRTRPVFENFVVDEKDRIWVQASAARGATTAECIIIGADGKDVAVINLPVGLTLEAIRAGKAVGVLREEDSGPIIVAFRVVE